MSSHTKIATLQAERIAKRLLNHWKHKFEVTDDGQEKRIMMPTATVVLSSESEYLNVRILSEETDLSRLQQVVLDHLIRMGDEPLSAVWQ